MRRSPRIRDLQGIGDSNARKLVAARIAGMREFAASIDTSELSSTAKASLDTAIREAAIESLAKPAGGDLLSFGATVKLNYDVAASRTIGAQESWLDDANGFVVNRWGLSDSEEIDVAMLITRLSIHLSVNGNGSGTPNAETIQEYVAQFIMGRWSLEAGETGRTELARGSMGDYMDNVIVHGLAYSGAAAALDGAGCTLSQNLTDRPWQGGMIVPAGYPLRFLFSDALDENEIAPDDTDYVEIVAQVSFQGIRIPGL